MHACCEQLSGTNVLQRRRCYNRMAGSGREHSPVAPAAKATRTALRPHSRAWISTIRRRSAGARAAPRAQSPKPGQSTNRQPKPRAARHSANGYISSRVEAVLKAGSSAGRLWVVSPRSCPMGPSVSKETLIGCLCHFQGKNLCSRIPDAVRALIPRRDHPSTATRSRAYPSPKAPDRPSRNWAAPGSRAGPPRGYRARSVRARCSCRGRPNLRR